MEWYWWVYIPFIGYVLYSIFQQAPFSIAMAAVVTAIIVPLKIEEPFPITTSWGYIIAFPIIIAAAHGLIRGFIFRIAEKRIARERIAENMESKDFYVAESEIDEDDFPKRKKTPQKPSKVSDEDFADSIHDRQLVEVLDVQGAADIHEVSEATIRKWLNEGELEGYKEGNRWNVPVYSEDELTVKEASELFGVSQAKIRDWLNEGMIAGYKDERNRWCVYAPDE